MSRARSPQARRKAMALQLAKTLEGAAERIHAYNLVRIECDDDPRAGQANDGLYRMAVELSDLSGWLESAAPTWES